MSEEGEERPCRDRGGAWGSACCSRAWRRQEGPSPGAFGGSSALCHLRVWTSSLQGGDRVTSVVSAAQGEVISSGAPRNGWRPQRGKMASSLMVPAKSGDTACGLTQAREPPSISLWGPELGLSHDRGAPQSWPQGQSQGEGLQTPEEALRVCPARFHCTALQASSQHGAAELWQSRVGLALCP